MRLFFFQSVTFVRTWLKKRALFTKDHVTVKTLKSIYEPQYNIDYHQIHNVLLFMSFDTRFYAEFVSGTENLCRHNNNIIY
jgi:hypothetical protein